MDKDSIWWTRKSWINAESRLLRYANWSNISLFWYSLCGVFASVLLLGEEQPNVISKVFICFSVFVFCASLFTSLGRYNERARKFKSGYIALQSLYLEVKEQTKLNNDDAARYSKILESCENCSWIDFLNAKVEAYNNAKDKSFLSIDVNNKDKVVFYLMKTLNIFTLASILMAPAAIIFISIYR
ncbi:SLATT domain-containing protein [Agarivorans sp. QJM3NY_29]|uniref:SLATT domain-containing protein n=1 Tax=unclassified Agarivorans TaxID=2636026 RepID=UPI003D7D3732